MLKDEVLALLKGQEDPRSGEEMSRTLGVSRAAVWKAIAALREEGYEIASAPNRGYLLKNAPDRLSAGELAGALEGCVIGRELICLEEVDSTNSAVKRRAVEGTPEGLAIVAECQTGGRGRRGRTFLSPAGKGIYCSVLLRPKAELRELLWITAWTGVAVCDAIETVCGIRPGIKWTNDIILGHKKVCGILTELGMEGESAQSQYVVPGIGINISQIPEDFGPEVAQVATSLTQELGWTPRRADVTAALLKALDRMNADFPHEKARYLEQYRKDCVNLGQPVRVLSPDGAWEGTAMAIDEDFQLVVRRTDGRLETVSAGEVSVRGLLGYV